MFAPWPAQLFASVTAVPVRRTGYRSAVRAVGLTSHRESLRLRRTGEHRPSSRSARAVLRWVFTHSQPEKPPPLRPTGAGLDCPGRSRTTPVVPRSPGSASAIVPHPALKGRHPEPPQWCRPFRASIGSLLTQGGVPRLCRVTCPGLSSPAPSGRGSVPWGGGFGLGIQCVKTTYETALTQHPNRTPNCGHLSCTRV